MLDFIFIATYKLTSLLKRFKSANQACPGTENFRIMLEYAPIHVKSGYAQTSWFGLATRTYL